MLVKNLSCPNQENTNYTYRLPFNMCCPSDTLGVNLFIGPCDDTANKGKVIYDKCSKDLKCEIDDKTKNEMKENIKNELKKDLKCEIDDKTKGEIKENIKNELKKDLKCEIDDKTKGEMEENIKNELKKDLKCEIDDETKNELKKNIKGELEKDLKCKCIEEEITKEIDESGCNRRGCENAREDGEYVNVGSDAKLYIRKALDKFYPDLSAEIIDKIKAGDYYVEQFGIEVTNCDKNGTDYSYITSRGDMNEWCVSIPPSDLCKESYDILQTIKDDWYENCKNHIFDDEAHVVSAKVYYKGGSIDKNKPVVVLSQNKPLIIADKKTHKLVKKDGTISDKTLDECKEFFDSDKRITSCAEEKGDCEVCKETIWDFQDVVQAFFI
ncbi:hypothetical protein [Wolbachia endosymbiont (group A) of Sphaerophoria taeniata]|uniref:hypothetical protein n=1 Tax=Wolbachia endosymbiont (group A) of Sphaerophoria taeniata TaxID=2954057 RepID=UPI002227967D|nr:hypothetical protein [Wolbachia endosymbiont (group A) of Sphaerophoria taeniata]